ncbi:phytanoyl-CoA dioxygenase family protein [Caulobacter sp. NIBR1757]|uniref:phytanoyl-CoA dioxygenase family protein n=1 Tax=Caulobacter sp. NIBR1757 TaxID=3016000 RepID=UPI0022F12246|nr:phytanoyl-CoA dioxygenase family protein [Caulobacter sp. NIBR1757]WGM39818.1 hypothetical protein AMEJIAPC_02752 [Caulobacter sp. NIBR1757]
MPADTASDRALGAAQIEQFITDGYVRLDDAFPRPLAEAVRTRLWRDMALDPDDPAGWTQSVVRLGIYSEAPFVDAANTARLHDAFDQLAGPGRWLPCGAMGTFPIRFPSPDDPGDTGWHVDMSFGWESPDFLDWRINVASRGRALLMLFLFSDIGEDDAPTRLRVGSHSDVARALAPAGEAGLSLRELMASDFGGSASRPQVAAVGAAGTVYLCHPFLVHAAQAHRGHRPRFLAQPPLLPARPLRLDGPVEDTAPIETAIVRALSG